MLEIELPPMYVSADAAVAVCVSSGAPLIGISCFTVPSAASCRRRVSLRSSS
jgi:hypothetical protein